MHLFTAIDDAVAIVRFPKGVHKQVKMYRRGEGVFLPCSGGYIGVRYLEHTGEFTTTHPDVKLVEYDAPPHTLRLDTHLGQKVLRAEN